MSSSIFPTPAEYDAAITHVRHRIVCLAVEFPTSLTARTRDEYRSIVGYKNIQWKKKPTELQFRTAMREAKTFK